MWSILIIHSESPLHFKQRPIAHNRNIGEGCWEDTRRTFRTASGCWWSHGNWQKGQRWDRGKRGETPARKGGGLVGPNQKEFDGKYFHWKVTYRWLVNSFMRPVFPTGQVRLCLSLDYRNPQGRGLARAYMLGKAWAGRVGPAYRLYRLSTGCLIGRPTLSERRWSVHGKNSQLTFSDY